MTRERGPLPEPTLLAAHVQGAVPPSRSLMDPSWLTPRLCVGGIPTRGDLADLTSRGVNAVLDVRDDGDDRALLLDGVPGVRYLHNPTADDGTRKGAAWFGASLDFAFGVLLHPPGRLYVHCHSGFNRGPSTAYAVLRALGLSPVIAEFVVRSGRPLVGLRYKDDADLAVKALGYE